jgi:hypothetical protein
MASPKNRKPAQQQGAGAGAGSPPAKAQDDKPKPGQPTPGPPPLKMKGFQKRRTEEEKMQIDRTAVYAATFLFFTVIYRIFFIDVTQVYLGIGRTIQPIEDFPFECRRVVHPLLEACEDFWIDDEGRSLYAACSDIKTRAGWNPGGGMFNASVRTGTDHISVMDLDNPGVDGLFGVRQLEFDPKFSGSIDLLNVQGQRLKDGSVRFWLVNHRPPVNATTNEVILDASTLGADSVVEIFDLPVGGTTLKHVRTVQSPALVTPNSIAVSADGLDFFVTNSHTRRVGLRRELEALTGGGSVAHCRTDTGECRIVTPASGHGLNFPNGIVRGADDHYYVATTLGGRIFVYRYEDGEFFAVNEAWPKVPLDNLSIDSDGVIIAAVLPWGRQSLKSIKEPGTIVAPASIGRLDMIPPTEEKPRPEYNFTTIIEDLDAKFLPTATVAVRDVKTKRLFISGVASQFITICESNL